MGAGAGSCCRESEDPGAEDPLDQDSWHRQFSGSATCPSSNLAPLDIAGVVLSEEPAAGSTSRASSASPKRSRATNGGGSVAPGLDHSSQPAAEEPEDTRSLGIQLRSSAGVQAAATSSNYDSSQMACEECVEAALGPTRPGTARARRFFSVGWYRSNTSLGSDRQNESPQEEEAALATDGSLLRRLGRAVSSLSLSSPMARKGSTGSLSSPTAAAVRRGGFSAAGGLRSSGSSLGVSVGSLSLGKSTSSLFAPGAELPPSPVSPPATTRKSEIGNAVVALIHMVADGPAESVAGSRRSSVDWGRQISELIDALDDEPDVKAQFSNHCYFYNLAIRGRRPKCMFKACECGRVHERIPDDIFESFPFPALQGLGSDSELRKRFAEIDSSNDGRLCEREVRDAIVRAGVTPKPGQIAIIMKLLVETDRGFIYFPEFCQMGRLSLQWYNTVCGLTPPQVPPHLQEASIRKFLASLIQQGVAMQVDHILNLFQKADVTLERATAQKLLCAVDMDHDGYLQELDIQKLLEALCIIAHTIQTGGDSGAAEALGRRADLVRRGVSAAFRGKFRADGYDQITARMFSERGIASSDMKNFFASLGLTMDAERLARVITLFDQDCNGLVEFDEFKRLFDISMKWHDFVKSLAKGASDMPSNLTDTELRREFVKIDRDDNGSIDLDELDACFKSKGIHISRAEIQKVMQLADTDGSNSMEWPEFKRMFTIISAATNSTL